MVDGKWRLALDHPPFAVAPVQFSSNPEFPGGIERGMRRVRLGIAAVLTFLLAPALLFAVPGSFRGVIVHGPDINPGWIWVQGAHGALRKVEVSHAQVEYDKSVPASERSPKPEAGIKAGVEVRITADQDGDGEWRASRIEILKTKAEKPLVTPSRRDMSNVWTS